MLSDMGIKEYIQKGLLRIDPMNQIGPASVDLHIGDRLYRSDSQAHYLYDREAAKAAKAGHSVKWYKGWKSLIYYYLLMNTSNDLVKECMTKVAIGSLNRMLYIMLRRLRQYRLERASVFGLRQGAAQQEMG